jgi:hypothetical protein
MRFPERASFPISVVRRAQSGLCPGCGAGYPARGPTFQRARPPRLAGGIARCHLVPILFTLHQENLVILDS